jgi:HAD superfamily hydrolase (TIGR01509 family)
MPIPPELPWTYRSVAFDLDGILVDTEPLFERAVIDMLARRGRELTAEAAHFMLGTTTRRAFVFVREHYGLDESVDELIAESVALLFALMEREPAPLMAGVGLLLERLEARGIPRGVATSSDREHVRRVLGPHGLLDRFGFILTCEDITDGKPHPEIYQKAARRFGHGPEAMVVLEDSPNGLRAAKAAGARCVVVPHARSPLHDLALADAIVPSLASPELHALLGV